LQRLFSFRQLITCRLELQLEQLERRQQLELLQALHQQERPQVLGQLQVLELA
jgi:hypothetical protein